MTAMGRWMKGLAAVAIGAAALVTSETAHAWCRTKACDTDPSYGDAWDGPEPTSCERNAQGCLIQGTPLWWKSGCLSFGVQRDGSKLSDIDYETARETIQQGFDTWSAADCGNGDTPSFRVVDDGEIECARAEYNQQGPNANVFMFRDDDWPYRNTSGDALALTTVTYSVETAEIYDADVELNAVDTLFTVSDEPDEIVSDLRSVVTHEIGHFLGLSHSENHLAVMRVGYNQGTTELRELTDDDIAGVCEIYPPGEISGSCTPRHGFSSQCGSDGKKDDDGGCSLRPSSARNDGNRARAASMIALAVLGLSLRRRRALRR